ncbi:MAG: PKD domain-containing protein [Bacteroidales bacterium]|nr:PKD domain-containing protein [Bacteroidales bacterium]
MKNFTLTLLCLLTFSGMLMAQWQPVDLGTGTTLKNLYAFDNQNAIIVGADTTILKTTDGGKVWETMNFTLPNKIDYDFTEVDFADNQTGFIVAPKKYIKPDHYNGFMLKTADGGTTWDEVSLTAFSDGSGNDLTDPKAGIKVQFRCVSINGNIGYAAVQWVEAATTTEHGYIFKTTDKGTTWAISSGDLGGIDINSIEFIGETVYAGGNGSYFSKSIDGGANWEDLSKGNIVFVSDIRLLDANKVYLATMQGTLYTEDGGVNINALNDIGAWDVIYFSDDNILFAGNGNASSTKKSYRSIDGGTSWQEATNGLNITAWDLTLFNDTIYALGNGGVVNKLNPSELKDPVIEFSQILKGGEAQFANESENCGSYTWKFTADSTSTIENPVYRFADYDAHTIKLIGENAVSSDSIEHEITVQAPTADFTFVTEDGNNVEFTNTSENCAEFEWNFGELSVSKDELVTSHVFSTLGTFTVKLTADNYIETVSVEKEITIDSVGAYWSKNQLEIDQNLQKMHVFNNDIAIAVGNGTTIIKSTDGGDTWTEKTFPSELDGHVVNDIVFFDDNTGLISASAASIVNGFMLKTVDKGENWTEIALSAFSDGSGDETIDPAAGIKVYFYSIHQIDENVAFVAVRWQDASSAYHGFVYKTSDKGETWAKSSNDIYQENTYKSTITDMTFSPDGTIGFIAGNKLLLKTSDSGATWTRVTGDDAFGYITEMLVLDNNTIIASTGNGVLKTTDCFANYEFKTTDYSFDIIQLGDDKFMAGKNAATLGVTEDFAETWENMGNGLSGTFFELTVFNNKIYAFSSKGLTSISYLDNYETPTVDFESSIEDLTVTFTDKSESIIASNWSFGDTENSTEVSPVHTYADYGKYEITLTGNNLCKKVSVTKEIELTKSTGIDNLNESSINVYPNPVTNNKVFIELGNSYEGDVNIEIYNTEGRLIVSEKQKATSLLELNVDLNKGFYFMKINNNKGFNKTTKLIVQ